MTVLEVKTGAEEKLIHKGQLAAYMEMIKLNPSLESPGLERIDLEDGGHEYKQIKPLPGVTTLLSIYRTWQFNNDEGKEAAERGSWIHRQCTKYDILTGKFRQNHLNWIQNDLPGQHKDGEFGKQCILSYLQFLKDYGLENVPVRNEVFLAGKGYAGTLDKIFMTPGPLKGYLLYLGKKYKVIPMTRRGYWMAYFQSALKVWQATNGKSKGFRQENKKMEVNDEEI